MLGYECLHCKSSPTPRDSHFCSPACRDQWCRDMPFVLTCCNCDADEGDCQTIGEAILAGWSGIEEDPDGATWNFIGECPDCKDKFK